MKYIARFMCILLLMPVVSSAQELQRVDASVLEQSIVVNASFKLKDTEVQGIKDGISKELTFYIDLFRVWRGWPDEFVIGKTFTRTLRCDQIKKEYVSTSFDGITLIDKRFQNCDSLILWATSMNSLRLINTSELQQDKYFVKVAVESRIRRLPPVIGQLFFFVKEKEFSVSLDSTPFEIGGSR